MFVNSSVSVLDSNTKSSSSVSLSIIKLLSSCCSLACCICSSYCPFTAVMCCSCSTCNVAYLCSHWTFCTSNESTSACFLRSFSLYKAIIPVEKSPSSTFTCAFSIFPKAVYSGVVSNTEKGDDASFLSSSFSEIPFNAVTCAFNSVICSS